MSAATANAGIVATAPAANFDPVLGQHELAALARDSLEQGTLIGIWAKNTLFLNKLVELAQQAMPLLDTIAAASGSTNARIEKLEKEHAVVRGELDGLAKKYAEAVSRIAALETRIDPIARHVDDHERRVGYAEETLRRHRGAIEGIAIREDELGEEVDRVGALAVEAEARTERSPPPRRPRRKPASKRSA